MAAWEAASRWNEVTLGWMTKGFRQWLTLMTTVPPRPDIAANAHPQARDTELRDERPTAHSEPKRPARAKARATTSKSKSKPRTRVKG
jgi:hypothetical protein